MSEYPILLIWEKHPEEVELYVIEQGSADATLALNSAGKYVNTVGVEAGDPVDQLHDALEERTAYPSDGALEGPFAKVVCAGIHL